MESIWLNVIIVIYIGIMLIALNIAIIRIDNLLLRQGKRYLDRATQRHVWVDLVAVGRRGTC